MKKRSTYFNILISYLVIMLTPMVLLGAMLFNFFYNTYDQEIIQNRLNSLRRLQVIMDNIVSEMQANAYSMLNSQEFSTSFLEEQFGNFYGTTKELSYITMSNAFISNAFYLNDETQRVYTPQTMYDYQDFSLYNNFGSGSLVGSALPETLVKDQRSYWVPMRQGSSGYALTYVVTSKISNKAPCSSMIFQIGQKTLDQLMFEFIPDHLSCVIIADVDKNILYTSNAEIADTAWNDWLDSGHSVPGQDFVKFKADGETYIGFEQPSMNSDISYISIVPYESLTKPIAFHKNMFFFGAVCIAGLCAVFIMYFMKINYASVHSVSVLVNSLLHTGDASAGTDTEELEATTKVLTEIKQREQAQARNKITLKLLSNGYTSLEAFEDESLRVNHTLMGPLFMVIIFQISDNPRPGIDRCNEIAKFIMDNLGVYVDCYPLIYPESASIFVTASGEEDELMTLNLKLLQLKQVVEHEFSISLTIGVGSKTAVDNVAASYSQASTACEYKFATGDDSITFFEDIEQSNPGKFIYPTRELDILYHAILQGDEERVQFAMQNLLNLILGLKSLFYCTCLSYDILNTAMKAMRELNCTVAELKEMDIVKTGVIRSIDDVVRLVDIISKKIVEILSQQRKTSEDVTPVGSFDQIMKYITDNYNSESFSVKSLASNFNMSISNFSHYFKKHTNQTVSEYILALRFDKAKEYLRTTDMNLQNVAAMCGYLHISTFMRQFKQREGCTPASYRARFRH